MFGIDEKDEISIEAANYSWKTKGTRTQHRPLAD